MPMSLKCMIDKWLHKGQISQEEYDEVIKKLDGHNKQIRAKAYQQGRADGFQEALTSHGINIYVDKIKADGAREFAEWLNKQEGCVCFCYMSVDKILAEWQKGEE